MLHKYISDYFDSKPKLGANFYIVCITSEYIILMEI